MITSRDKKFVNKKDLILMFSRLKSIPLILTIWLALVLLLSACSSGVERQPREEHSNPPSPGPLESTDVSEIPTLTAAELPAPAEEAAGDGPELGFALGDPNLRATDPDTVVLASGQIQLIEFFAFW